MAAKSKEIGGSQARSPLQEAGLLQRLTFGYGLPLMRKGASRPLVPADLPPICPEDHAQVVCERLLAAWSKELEVRPHDPSLWRTLLLRAFWWKTFLGLFYLTVESTSRIVQSVFLHGLLQALEEGEVSMIYIQAGALVLASLLQAVVHHQLFFVTMTMGWNLRIGLVGMLHWKLLRLRASWVQDGSTDCYNLVANDCQRFELAMPFLHGWIALIELVAVGALLVLDVGWWPMFCGVAVVLLFATVMVLFGQRLARQRRLTSGFTDERLRLTSQVFEAVMSVKIYCWEDAFVSRLAELRSREHKSIFRRQVMIAVIGTMYYSLAPAASLALFFTYAALRGRLSLATAYTALSLLQVLRVSFGKMFAKMIETLPECHAAVGRISHFLAQPEVPPRNPVPGDPALTLAAASFAWPGSGQRALEAVSCHARLGELLVVTGPVGCGKSALLQALLGELESMGGTCELHGSVAYAPQTPWIMAGTLRSNVLLGAAFDEQLYWKVIAACGLHEDLVQLGSLGDETEIGERGVNLSGGQRARVGLARAVYARPDVALLDDPLAAVDAEVGAHLVRECLRGDVLRGSAVVLCTHHESIFALADTLLLLGEGGVVRACGPPQQVAEQCGFKLGAPVLRKAKKAAAPAARAEQEGSSSLIKTEDQRKGAVNWRTYLRFARLASVPLAVLVFGLFLASQVALLLSNYWLGLWTEAEDGSEASVVFAALTGLTVLLASLRSVLFYHATLRASSSLHRRALHRVLGTHLGFFTANPLGRIMNRFSGDLGNVDELLSTSLHEVTDLGFIGAGAVLLVCITVPPAIPLLVAMFYYMLRLRRFVVKSMTELKRLESVSRSPVFDCFTASLRGLTCLRAFGRERAAQERMLSLLDHNAQAWFWWLITNRFIGFRLDLQCVLIVAFAAFGGAALRSFIPPELVALATVQAISLSGIFQFMVRQSALVESYMTSFERLQTFAELPPEGEQQQFQSSAKALPESRDFFREPKPKLEGAVAMAGLKLRYREDLPEVLKGVDFACPEGAKVGICGRTGSGKSSIFMALARLADVTGGCAVVAGADAANMPLRELRRRIAWVPQEPQLFSGSLRFNLDPLGEHSDEQLWTALRSVQMAEGLRSLDLPVAERGSNFSVGERQLLSLARALLQRRSVLCMDEAFANVDFATDGKVQAAVRTLTRDDKATVLVIAHRLQTLADADHVIVMEDGRVAEQGAPDELLRRNGAYARLATADLGCFSALQQRCRSGIFGALGLAGK